MDKAETTEPEKLADPLQTSAAESQPGVKIAEPEMEKAQATESEKLDAPGHTLTVESHVDVKIVAQPETIPGVQSLETPAVPEIPTNEGRPKHEGTSPA
jgi:hypothetical protein